MTENNREKEYTDWHPVINHDRCTSCGKCLNFCLFGVYSVDDDKKVVVSSPANCKDQCPACARVCPEHAIIFPLSPEPAINGTEEPGDNSSCVELEQLVEGDVYGALAARRKRSKLSLLKKQDIQKAEQERELCSMAVLPQLVVNDEECGADCSCHDAVEEPCNCSGDCDTCEDCICDENGCDCDCDCSSEKPDKLDKSEEPENSSCGCSSGCC